MVHLGLGEHGKVLDLGLAKGRAVRGDEDHLGLAGAEALEARLVAEDGLARLHDELETRVHRLNVLLLLDFVAVVRFAKGLEKNEATKNDRFTVHAACPRE